MEKKVWIRLDFGKENKYSKVCEAETENYLGFASENFELHLMSCMQRIYFWFKCIPITIKYHSNEPSTTTVTLFVEIRQQMCFEPKCPNMPKYGFLVSDPKITIFLIYFPLRPSPHFLLTLAKKNHSPGKEDIYGIEINDSAK